MLMQRKVLVHEETIVLLQRRTLQNYLILVAFQVDGVYDDGEKYIKSDKN